MAATGMHTKIDAIPSLGAEYRKIVADKLPVVGTKRSAVKDPGTGFIVEGVSVDPAHLAAYNQAVGFRTSNELPLTYPYVLAFPVAMKVMGAKDFPYSAMGAVHISNEIEQRRPITVDEECDLRVYATNLRAHRRGLLIDMVTEVEIAGEKVWSQVSTFLGMGARLSKDADAAVKDRGEDRGTHLEASKESPESTHTALWKVTASDIKQYAEASGDKNPVHVSSVGAKAFGFPNVIAHGMWTAAKMLTLLEGRVAGPVRYTVDFAKPVVVPARISCWAQQEDRAWSLEVRSAKKTEKLHAIGRVEQL